MSRCCVVQVMVFHECTPPSPGKSKLRASSASAGGGSSKRSKPQSISSWLQCPAPPRIVSIDAGGDVAAAVDDRGRLFTWGNRDDGRLGLGAVFEDNDVCVVTAPRQVPRFYGVEVTSVSVGYSHGGAITAESELWMWGSNEVRGPVKMQSAAATHVLVYHRMSMFRRHCCCVSVAVWAMRSGAEVKEAVVGRAAGALPCLWNGRRAGALPPSFSFAVRCALSPAMCCAALRCAVL
jgi:hypothetical protein